jgi:hypothetical protein
MAQDVNDFLDQAGMPGVKFENIGDEVSGTIVRAEVKQGRDFETGAPTVWDDGTPKMEIHVDLDTGVIDRKLDSDDGCRRLYVRGAMLTAVRTAVKKSGSKMLPGGWLHVTYAKNGDPPKKGLNPPKLFEAEYKPSDGGVNVDELA